MKNVNEKRRALENEVRIALKKAMESDEKYSLYKKENNDVFNSTSFVLTEKFNDNNCVQGSYYFDCDGDLVLQWCK